MRGSSANQEAVEVRHVITSNQIDFGGENEV
jgi:hypothetical protein